MLPAAMIGVIIAKYTYPRFENYFVFDLDEIVALYLIGPAAGLYLVRAVLLRRTVDVVLAILAGAFLVREIHFDYGSEYILMAGLFVTALLGVLWRKRIASGILEDPRQASWVICMFVVYVVSQLITKRIFRFIPGEGRYHSHFEEATETAAHIMFVVSALVAKWRIPRSAPKQGGGENANSSSVDA